MRSPARFLALTLIITAPERTISAQATPAADGIPTSVRWNRLVNTFMDENAASRRAARAAAAGDAAALKRLAQTPAPLLFRVYPLLTVAQYGALNTARASRGASADIAIASASATVLEDQFTDPGVRASIARELARDVERAKADQAAAGQRVGEDVAHRVLAWAPPFNLVAPWNGTVPTGPGMWFSAPGMPPIGIAMASSRPWALDSASQFRPAPPPAFSSPVFKAAIEEVKRVARERTPEQTKIAQKWNSIDPFGVWNEAASAAIVRNRLSELDAVRVLATLNVGASDAAIACFDAKYHYWTIRPTQADSTIALADSVGLPNFPSYPSGHACTAGAFDAVLSHFFPKERAEFTRMAEEQAMSRLYGGIHYRFDNDGGLALGRIVARHDVDREKHGGLYAWRTFGAAGKP